MNQKGKRNRIIRGRKERLVEHIYKVLIRPASETWTVSETNERRLILFERKVLRCISGAKQVNGTWRKSYNYELYETFKEPNIFSYIKVKILEWAGYLMRMNNDRTLTKIVNTKTVRRVRRPKSRWENGVDQDMRITEVKGWNKFALDRDEWAKLLVKAKAHQGLSSL
jgi:hypothetical protein